MDKLEFRRHLRAELTPAERALWYALRAGRFKLLKFRRQHSIDRYTVDFYCANYKLVIELDGGVHEDIGQEAYDRERDEVLTGLGYRVLRFRNEEVMECLECVLTEIERVVFS